VPHLVISLHTEVSYNIYKHVYEFYGHNDLLVNSGLIKAKIFRAVAMLFWFY